MIQLQTVKSFLISFYFLCRKLFFLPCITYCAIRHARHFNFKEKGERNDFVLIFFSFSFFSLKLLSETEVGWDECKDVRPL